MNYPRQSILFISGLDRTVNESQLYTLFNEFPISYIKIAKDHQTRESYGYAFVGFKNHSKAEEALIKLNYSKLLKRTIRISWYNREPNNYRAHPEYNIFVKKIPRSVTCKEFHDYFSKFGNIISAKLVEDDEGETVGYGFVLFDSEDAASNAIAECNNSKWLDKEIYVGRFEKNRPKKLPLFNTVYVKNIPKEYSKEDVIKLFSRYGEVTDVFMKVPDPALLEKLPTEKKAIITSHQFAFVTFKDFNSAGRVVNEFPYFKLNDNEYNRELTSLAEVVEKLGLIDNQGSFKFACYLLENFENYREIINDQDNAREVAGNFKKILEDNDNIYILKNNKDHLECFQALKKKDRIKKLKALYEKIKKQIKEKYKFCNLYVKNLPDNIDETILQQLFEQFGKIRSCKTVKKELIQSYFIKRSVKVFAFVCFFEKEQAREAKVKLHNQDVFNQKLRLYVDYHQPRKEREEFLKINLVNQVQKNAQNKLLQQQMQGGIIQDIPFQGLIRNIPNLGDRNLLQLGMGTERPFPGNFNQNMIRKFPNQMNQMNFMNQQFNNIPHQNQIPIRQIEQRDESEFINDKNLRNDILGEKLFAKLITNQIFERFRDFFPKVVGIFLELSDNTIEQLLNDDIFFNKQVTETIRLLIEDKDRK